MVFDPADRCPRDEAVRVVDALIGQHAHDLAEQLAIEKGKKEPRDTENKKDLARHQKSRQPLRQVEFS